MDVSFRTATYHDAEKISRVLIDIGFARFVFHTVDPDKVTTHLLEEYFPADRRITIVVGEYNGGIIAYSMFGPYQLYKGETFPAEQRNYAYSKGTGVLPTYRRQGIGERLRLYADSVAKQQGYAGMYTDVATINKDSLSVQRRTGFTEIATVQDPKREPGVGSVIFRKEF